MKVRNVVASAAVCVLVSLGVSVGQANAGGLNYGKAWETLGGARWNGYVQIKASYRDGGKHAKQGYHRFTRKAGPSLDTGRMYTARASSRLDTRVHSRKDSVWDSPLWGDKYTTKYNYNFIYW
ncbi:MAG: hypothetical protein Q4C74_02360 [Rothia sp. (in: high G+C Gram-positive bacteria)]|nr:hypothetical protein [Rothia sp. (in: high G+C Gram-positive bacteria)]